MPAGAMSATKRKRTSFWFLFGFVYRLFFLARRLAIFIRLSRFQLQISFSFSCFHRLLKILISFFFFVALTFFAQESQKMVELLRSDIGKMRDENGALIRVISKLSK